jgi:glutamate--cysteine ligase
VRLLTVDSARDRILDRCLTPDPAPAAEPVAGGGRPDPSSVAPAHPARVRRVGLEIEWHTRPVADPRADVCLEDLRRWVPPAADLPGRSAITWEPGGQLELSSPPARGVQAAIDGMAADAEVVRAELASRGIELLAAGVDPLRSPTRQLHAPRYDAMEAYFDGDGPEGRVMMSRTASLQVNLDGGDDDAEAERRWRRANLLGPTLIAAFANSPYLAGRRTGWCSTRQVTWFAMDPTRTSSAWMPPGRLAWMDYALAARVMFIRHDDDRFVPLQRPMSFARWLSVGHELGWPTVDDLDYHLTTLFPPVRPRRWLELRYLDALPDPWWRVAAAVTTALLDDEEAGAVAEEAARPTSALWCEAARVGLGHPALAASAARCVTSALEALDRLGVDRTTSRQCAGYADRYVFRGRCPADDWPEQQDVDPCRS